MELTDDDLKLFQNVSKRTNEDADDLIISYRGLRALLARLEVADRIATCYCFHGHDCYHIDLLDEYCKAVGKDVWGNPAKK